jgi:hypothetical protein
MRSTQLVDTQAAPRPSGRIRPQSRLIGVDDAYVDWQWQPACWKLLILAMSRIWTDQHSDSTGSRDTKMARAIPRQAAMFPIAAELVRGCLHPDEATDRMFARACERSLSFAERRGALPG